MKSEKRSVWEERVGRWAQTGLSRSEFAAAEGVDPHALSNWKWELTREKATPRGKGEQRKSKPRFIEIVRAEASAPKVARASRTDGVVSTSIESRFELVLKSGIRILVPTNFEQHHLRRLVCVVGEQR